MSKEKLKLLVVYSSNWKCYFETKYAKWPNCRIHNIVEFYLQLKSLFLLYICQIPIIEILHGHSF